MSVAVPTVFVRQGSTSGRVSSDVLTRTLLFSRTLCHTHYHTQTHTPPTNSHCRAQTHRELTAKLQRAAATERQSVARIQELESTLARTRAAAADAQTGKKRPECGVVSSSLNHVDENMNLVANVFCNHHFILRFLSHSIYLFLSAHLSLSLIVSFSLSLSLPFTTIHLFVSLCAISTLSGARRCPVQRSAIGRRTGILHRRRVE